MCCLVQGRVLASNQQVCVRTLTGASNLRGTRNGTHFWALALNHQRGHDGQGQLGGLGPGFVSGRPCIGRRRIHPRLGTKVGRHAA